MMGVLLADVNNFSGVDHNIFWFFLTGFGFCGLNGANVDGASVVFPAANVDNLFLQGWILPGTIILCPGARLGIVDFGI